MIHFELLGKPVSQGSVQYVPIRIKGGGYLTKEGRPVLRPCHQNSGPLNKWRRAIAVKARQVMGDLTPFTGPVAITVVIDRQRPKSHYRSNGELRDNAPEHVISRPDTLKLVRAIEDALTGVVWKDDSQIVGHQLRKQWGPVHKIVVNITAGEAVLGDLYVNPVDYHARRNQWR